MEIWSFLVADRSVVADTNLFNKVNPAHWIDPFQSHAFTKFTK